MRSTDLGKQNSPVRGTVGGNKTIRRLGAADNNQFCCTSCIVHAKNIAISKNVVNSKSLSGHEKDVIV
jgi:hypothetical protein